MKTVFYSIFRFVKKEWFLLIAISAIAVIILLFETL